MANVHTHCKILLGRLALLLAVSLLAVLAGCVQKTPIPYSASPGDTIVLGLGGIQRNGNGANLSASDVTITLTNNSTQTVTTVAPGNFYKAFPDYTSTLNLKVFDGVFAGQLLPFDGGWFVTLLLPNNGTLSPGAYTISITSPTGKLVNTKWCFQPSLCEGDLTNIPLQIVPSNGVSNSSYAQQFGYYVTASNLLHVAPSQTPDSVGYPTVGGLQLVVNFPAAKYNATQPVMALPSSHNPSIALLQNIVDNGDGTKSLVVLLTASQGFVVSANRTPFTPVLSDLSLSFFYVTANGTATSSAQQLGDFQIDQSRSHYYDPSGNVIAALQPVMTYQ